MKIKLWNISKTKKIILLGLSIGILTAIITPIVVLKVSQNLDQNKVNAIKQKIKNKDILIAPNVLTQNQNEIQRAIKNQLQKENDLLTNSDLSKIIISISSLDIGVKTEIILTIKVNYATSTLKIYVEKINLLKNSNIDSGEYGTIFQDDFKNLWVMGNRKKLQVLRVNNSKNSYVSTGWIDDNSNANNVLLKNSNIISNYNGKIFQDSFKNLWAMGDGTSLQVLKANSFKNGYVTTGWTNANSGLTKNSNIIDGSFGIIFQDEFKNLWSMGTNTKLQVLRTNAQKKGYVTTGWTNANSGLTKNSNIVTGQGGAIFQDSFKNLWSMGSNTKLQVIKVNDDSDGYDETIGWTNANSGLTKNSNINFGGYGTIFQDSFKNLWAMGYRKSLQVLKVNDSKNGYDEAIGWNDSNDNGLLLNSNITNGQGGTIFQDKFKNLWAMGNGTSLQVLKSNSQKKGYDEAIGWNDSNDNGLLLNSNITNGQGGTIFQDEFKNLWAMGDETSLQVFRINSEKTSYDETTGWTSANSRLLKGSNIENGYGGTIFQDKFKNLWAMGGSITKTIKEVKKTIPTKLQVFKINVAKDDYVDSWQKPSG